MNRKILGALFLLIVAALGAGYWGTKRSARKADEACIQVITSAKNSTTGEIKEYSTPCDVPAGWEIVDNSMSTNPLLIGNDAIYVPDQKPGKTVEIHTVVMSDKGFVAIHQDSNGKPGAIIGTSKLLPMAGSEGVVITLSRETRNQEVLFAVLHKDDGDGVFNATKDLIVRDDADAEVMIRFTIDVNARPAFESKL